MLERVIGPQIKVVCRLAPELPAVEVDPPMLEQVITNLAVNARDAMSHGGTLTLDTRFLEIPATAVERHPEAQPGPTLCLRVADTGTGISPELLTHIFEPFFTTKEVGKGTGLGLAAVHGTIQQHHGWIEVTSVLGRGTTFEIFLPASTAPASAPETPRAEPIETTPEIPRATILLVEDEPSVRHLARLTLELSGYDVLEAADGPTAEAVWIRESDRISLLCTDLMMPNGLSGRDLAGLFLEDKPELRVIYCSGYSAELALPGFFETPGQRFLQKPFLPNDLITLVRESLSSTPEYAVPLPGH